MSSSRAKAMTDYSVVAAKRRFSALLTEVESGKSVTITRRGQPIAVLHPARKASVSPVVPRRPPQRGLSLVELTRLLVK